MIGQASNKRATKDLEDPDGARLHHLPTLSEPRVGRASYFQNRDLGHAQQDLLQSAATDQQSPRDARARSAVQNHHHEASASYTKDVLRDGNRLSEAVEPWRRAQRRPQSMPLEN